VTKRQGREEKKRRKNARIKKWPVNGYLRKAQEMGFASQAMGVGGSLGGDDE